MAIVNGANYDHVDLQAVTGGDTTRHMLQDTAGRAMLAPIESSSTASSAHAKGSYFIYDGNLYCALANIAQGGSIVTSGSGQNCEEVTVGGELARLEEEKADINGYYEGMTVGDAEQLVATVGVQEKVPYNFRTSGGSADIGDREVDTVIGGTVAWNQLVNTDSETVTVASDHKYFASLSGVESIGISDGTPISVTGGTDNVIDLTLAFGSAIADYINTLETATPGAGVAWFRALFPKPYYAYDAGSLQNVRVSAHKTVGFNAYDNTTGKALVVGGQEYQITGTYTALSLDGETVTPVSGKFTPAKSGELTVTGGDGTTCIHLRWDGERDGEFEAYKAHTYPLDSNLVLRGVPMLDGNNKLYYDGDTYESNGTVTRKYRKINLGYQTWTYIESDSENEYSYFTTQSQSVFFDNQKIICQKYGVLYPPMGGTAFSRNSTDKVINHGTGNNARYIKIRDTAYTSAEDFKAAMSGVYLICEAAEPTTETAAPYQNPQIVDDFGTEQYVDAGDRDVEIPVGHDTFYRQNLRAKLEMVPGSPDSNGDYLVRHNNGQNSYVQYVSPLPAMPAEDGTYTLKCTVSDGTATLSWEADEA